MTERSPVYESDFFQLGYVTGDLDRAVELWKTRYGIPGFLIFDTRDHAPPGSPGPFIKVALGYQGPIMVELIEPDPANPGIYRDSLRADGGAELHHLGYLVDLDRFDGMKERFEALGSPVPTLINRVGAGGPALLYADTRAETGLFSEIVARTDNMREMFGRIPVT
jgi:hypothetical protein